MASLKVAASLAPFPRLLPWVATAAQAHRLIHPHSWWQPYRRLISSCGVTAADGRSFTGGLGAALVVRFSALGTFSSVLMHGACEDPVPFCYHVYRISGPECGHGFLAPDLVQSPLIILSLGILTDRVLLRNGYVFQPAAHVSQPLAQNLKKIRIRSAGNVSSSPHYSRRTGIPYRNNVTASRHHRGPA
jgi:hypothetical protein